MLLEKSGDVHADIGKAKRKEDRHLLVC